MRNTSFLMLLFAFVFNSSCTKYDNLIEDYVSKTSLNQKWVCSENLRITINQIGQLPIYLTKGHEDYKPVWSASGDKIVFFRVQEYGSDFKDWRTKLCVIDADGKNFKELTTANYPNFNPTWTRDGSNKIILNRYAPQGGWKNEIFFLSPNNEPGSEILISHPSGKYYEWAMSGLKDGRIFIDRITNSGVKSYLLTPNPGNEGKYEEIKRPTTNYWHKLSVSPSETKVAYMLDMDGYMPTYEDVFICYAEFDLEKMEVKNQVIISEDIPDAVFEYPRWSTDEKFIIYDSNKTGKYQMYAYSFEDDSTYIISLNSRNDYQFGNFINLPK